MTTIYIYNILYIYVTMLQMKKEAQIAYDSAPFLCNVFCNILLLLCCVCYTSRLGWLRDPGCCGFKTGYIAACLEQGIIQRVHPTVFPAYARHDLTRMQTFPVIIHLYVPEDCCFCLFTVRKCCPFSRSCFNLPQKLSMGTLSTVALIAYFLLLPV